FNLTATPPISTLSLHYALPILLRPAIATVAVFTIVPIWNDLWFPLILTSSDKTHTVTLGVQQFLGQYITDWNSVLAALSMAILRSEEHTSELQSRSDLVCRLLL